MLNVFCMQRSSAWSWFNGKSEASVTIPVEAEHDTTFVIAVQHKRDNFALSGALLSLSSEHRSLRTICSCYNLCMGMCWNFEQQHCNHETYFCPPCITIKIIGRCAMIIHPLHWQQFSLLCHILTFGDWWSSTVLWAGSPSGHPNNRIKRSNHSRERQLQVFTTIRNNTQHNMSCKEKWSIEQRTGVVCLLEGYQVVSEILKWWPVNYYGKPLSCLEPLTDHWRPQWIGLADVSRSCSDIQRDNCTLHRQQRCWVTSTPSTGWCPVAS